MPTKISGLVGAISPTAKMRFDFNFQVEAQPPQEPEGL